MKKLAIIGGGIAGVTAAYLLQDKYEITLFENNEYLGGNNFSTPLVFGNNIAEVPMAVITFPRKSLFKHTIGYAKKFNLPLAQKTIPHAFTLNQSLQYCLGHYPKVPKDLSFKRIKREINDFWYLFVKFKNYRLSSNLKINDLVKAGHISENCVRYFLLPFASLYMSMPYQALFDLPVSIIADWWAKYSLPIYSLLLFSYIKGGNHQLVNAFAKNSKFDLRAKTKVLHVSRSQQEVKLHYSGNIETFDKVIIATRPDEAINLLESPSINEQSILGKMDTGSMVTTLHKNPDYSYHGALTINVCETKGKDPFVISTWGQNTCFGYNLQEEHYVSINQPDIQLIKDEDIIRQNHLKIPLPTKNTIDVLCKIDSLNETKLNTYFCGSYFGSFFYHEDAISSAIKVAKILEKE